MCGIVGYYGHAREVLPTLMNGLKRLEYRGYDSAGVAIVSANKQIFAKKAAGKVMFLEEKIAESVLPEFGNVGIAHTRWATHGVPSEENAHPHHSFNKKIWLVHNGIIENYAELKNRLKAEGIEFYSQTDTEVIANLVAYYYKGNLQDAVVEAIKDLQGAYAIAVIASDEPDRLVAAKMGAPLVLGIGEEEFVIASDVSAIISKTRDVIFLEDGELLNISNHDYIIRDVRDEFLSPLSKIIERVEWDADAASKEGFEHFLMKEITEQKKSLADSCRGRLIEDEGNIKFGGLIDIQDRLKDIQRVEYLLVYLEYQ